MTRIGRWISTSFAAVAATARSRNLRLMQMSFGAAWTAEVAFTVAISVVAFRDGGAAAVGLVAFLRAAPSAVLAPFGTALADRFRRDRVLVWVGIVRGAATAAAAVVLALDGPIIAIYALAVVATAAFVVVRPVHAALQPLLCSTPLELTNANVVRGLVDSLSALIGPAIAAVLLEVSSAAAVIGVAAGLSAWSGIVLLGISYEAPARSRSASPSLGRIITDTAEGFRAIRHSRDAVAVSGIAVAQVFTRGCLSVFFVVIAVELLETGEAGVAVLGVALGAGAVIGSLGASALVSGRGLARIQGGGVALWGVPLVLIAGLPVELAVLVLLGVVGIGNAMVDVGLFTLLPRFVDEHLLARVFGALESLFAVALAAGALLTPAVIAAVGIRGALVILGLVAPVAVIAVWRHLRSIDASMIRRDVEIELLRRVEMFRPLPMPAIENLALRSTAVDVPAGTVVMREGEPGDSFFVIEAGQAGVFNDETLIEELTAGAGFGEIALLTNRPRTATVRARSALRLCRIDRGPFLASVGDYSSCAVEADRMMARNLSRFDPS